MAIEVGLNLDLAGTTFVDFHPPSVCTGSQLALPSLPCQPQGFSETLLGVGFSRLTVCSFPRASLQTGSLCSSVSVSSVSRETASRGGEGKRQNGANPTSVLVERQCNGPGRERENYSWITE